MVVEHSSEDVPVEEVVVEVKIPLQTMDPLRSSGTVTETLPPSSSELAMVLSLPEIGAPDPSSARTRSLMKSFSAFWRCCTRGSTRQATITVAMDLSFLESMAVGIKEMQSRHNQKWQVLKEQRKSTNKVDQQLRDKGNKLRDWHSKQF